MKRLIVFLMLTVVTLSASSQSDETLRDYYRTNLAQLDPIEGIYDVECYGDYVTPFVHQEYGKEQATFYIKRKIGDTFEVYLKADDGNPMLWDELKITKVGQTNVYYFYFISSKCRIYLTDNSCHFIAKLAFDHNTAVQFTGNSKLAPSVKIYYTYDCIKTYPTY